MDTKTEKSAAAMGEAGNVPFTEAAGQHATIDSRASDRLAGLQAKLSTLARSLERLQDSLLTDCDPPEELRTGPRPPLHIHQMLNFAFDAGWQGWSPSKGATVGDRGQVQIPRSTETSDLDAPGLVSPRISAPDRRLLRIRVTLTCGEAADPDISLHVRNEADEPIAHNLRCTTGVSEHFVFVSRRTQSLQLHLLCDSPKQEFAFVLEAISVDSVDADSYQARVRHDLGAPVIAAMASVPERREMLADAVESLLVQCDEVRVFLNGYPDVPDFLLHPRIDVRRSQDWDDRGDAGKFSWLDMEEPPGYRIAADDDIIFPPTFSEVMVAKLRSYSDHAFVGMHGVLLRQPIQRYYGASSRTALHFETELRRDYTVHLLGTNAFIYHSGKLSMRWADLTHRNMADVFVALYAQEHKIPMITPARPRLWLRENKQSTPFETIYLSSRNTTGTHMDTSDIQDALLKRAAPLTTQPTARPKIVVCVIASDQEETKSTFSAWENSNSVDFDWVFIVCQADDQPELHQTINDIKIAREAHFVNNLSAPPVVRLAKALMLATQLHGDLLIIASDALRAPNSKWIRSILPAFEAGTPLSLFGHLSQQGAIEFGPHPVDAGGALPVVTVCSQPQAVAAGSIDTRIFSLADAFGEWLARLALVGSNRSYQEIPSEITATLQATSTQRLPDPVLPDQEQLRAKVGWLSAPNGRMRRNNLNDAFDRICVVSAHPANMDKMKERLTRAKIKTDRIVTVPHQVPLQSAVFEAYAASPLIPIPADVRRVTSPFELYRDYDSQTARLAYEEHRICGKAIPSLGSWAYLDTWQSILETAIKNRIETLLVLQDDVYFHKNSQDIFQEMYREIPDDWLAVQLGAFQCDWGLSSGVRRGTYLHQTDGVAVGSYAVGLRFESFPLLLDLVKSRTMPFDLGPLSALSRSFGSRCFVVKPNIAIQRPHEEGGDRSGFSPTHAAPFHLHWHLPDYDIE